MNQTKSSKASLLSFQQPQSTLDNLQRERLWFLSGTERETETSSMSNCLWHAGLPRRCRLFVGWLRLLAGGARRNSLCICALLFSHPPFSKPTAVPSAVRFGPVVLEHSGRAFSLSRSYPRCVQRRDATRRRFNRGIGLKVIFSQ